VVCKQFLYNTTLLRLIEKGLDLDYNSKIMSINPGMIALLGSGETSNAGGLVFETLIRQCNDAPRICVLETPAGFELNSARVAGKIAEYLKVRLQNYYPRIQLLPARKRGTAFSPDDPLICAPLLESDVIFFGPGSPTYTVRQLTGSTAWDYIVSRHRLGACLALASAATISLGSKAIPVYEIYKVGEDLHWKPGLNFFANYGLDLVFVPHWNNSEGGAELDTSRCFIGRERFEWLRSQLDPETTIVGMDEHTAIIINLAAKTCLAIGRKEVHILKGGVEKTFRDGQEFSIQELGPFHPIHDPSEGIPASAWEKAMAIANLPVQESGEDQPETEVVGLLELRRLARSGKNWAESDRLRDELAGRGWRVVDTAEGQKLIRPS
jgi:hypothetical protein